MLDIGINLLRKNPKKLSYLLDDFTKEVMTDDELAGIMTADFDIMVSRSSDDAMLLQMIEQNFQQAVASGTASIGDLITVFKTESVQDAARIMKKKEQEKADQQQRMQEQQMQVQQQALQQQQQMEQMKMELEMKKLEIEKYKIDTEAQTRLQIATLQTYNRQQELDLNMNQIPDPLELEKIYQKERETDSKKMDRQLELQVKQTIEQQKIALEDRKLQTEREIEQMKAETAKEVERMKLRNPVSGEKISKKK
jgi:hypothetical protein